MRSERVVPLVLPAGQATAATLERSGATGRVAPGSGTQVLRLRRGQRSLPVLLAGPILRRCTIREITVWVATSAPVRVSGRVHLANGSGGQPNTAPTIGSSPPTAMTAIGERLFIGHIRLRAHGAGFPTGAILSYDLTFHAPDGQRFTGDAGLLKHRDIAYGSARLPTFILDGSGAQYTHLVHSSCRKAHGPGRDAVVELNEHLSSRWSDLVRRPRCHLMTGDQIYADDVHGGLLRALKRAGRELLGFRESFPNNSRRYTEDVSNRASVVRDFGGLTVDAGVADNHLLSFGEFAAMYLFMWSPVLWDALGMRSTIERGDDHPTYADAVTMRRVLANVPNYMMIDDHEVTDDWPMDQTQLRRIERSSFGRWIIGNGLASAYLFQLQGNGMNELPCLAALQQYLASGAATARSTVPELIVGHRAQTLRKLNQYVTQAYRMGRFSVVAPTHPPVLLLDTRTQRAFSDTGAPGLLDGRARQWLRTQFASLAAGQPLLIVSPAPVVANAAYDGIQGVAAGVNARYYGDREGWGHNPYYFRDFLRTLAHARRPVVVFSGDVHFGYTAHGSFQEGNNSAYVLQLTSSSMRNKPTGGSAGFLLDNEDGTRRTREERLPGNGGTWRYSLRTFNGESGLVQHTLFLHNNIGAVKVDWRRSRLEVVHKLRGEGQTKTVTVQYPPPTHS